MHRFALAAVLAAAAGFGPAGLSPVGLAHAQSRAYGYEAELAQAARRAAVTAGGVQWTCAATRCTASGRGGNVSVKGCSELARAVGPVAAYRSEIKTLPEGSLRECNRIAQAAGAGAAKAAKAPAKPQRAATPEIQFTGVAPGGETAERRQ
jgi:hypothetical protein